MERNEVDSLQLDGPRSLTGDGGDPGQVAKAWMASGLSCSGRRSRRTALNDISFFPAGVFHSEHLVNMSQHNYIEPNVRFSPDKSLVIFTSNMFGPGFVFGVEKAANPAQSEVMSIVELAAKWNPGKPASTPPNK